MGENNTAEFYNEFDYLFATTGAGNQAPASGTVPDGFPSAPHSYPSQPLPGTGFQEPNIYQQMNMKRPREDQVHIKDEDSDGDKKLKRRKQIAAASRMSRARRKRELEDLKDENERLRDERSQFLAKISELQYKIEKLRNRGSTGLQAENELLRTQLSQHQAFVSSFQSLSNAAPRPETAKQSIHTDAVETAYAKAQSMIALSQSGSWTQACVSSSAPLPFENFSVFYAVKHDTETNENFLEIRIDFLFPNKTREEVSQELWELFTSTVPLRQLYGIKEIEVTKLEELENPPNTTVLYYREASTDCVLIANKRTHELAMSTLALPNTAPHKIPLGKVTTTTMIASVMNDIETPEVANVDRVRAMVVQGMTLWDSGDDCRLCACFSFPEDVNMTGISKLADVVDVEKGCISERLTSILKQFNQMIMERI